MKKLIYTIICFKCILGITEGSPYHKYIKLFSNLLILCMCCSMILSLKQNVESTYIDLKTQWEEALDFIIDEEDIENGSRYYEEKLLEVQEYESVD